MKKRGRLLTAFGFLLAGVVVLAAPAFAQSVDDKIKSLEQELSQLKDQQVEMKKEATAAAAAVENSGRNTNFDSATAAFGAAAASEASFASPAAKSAFDRTGPIFSLLRNRRIACARFSGSFLNSSRSDGSRAFVPSAGFLSVAESLDFAAVFRKLRPRMEIIGLTQLPQNPGTRLRAQNKGRLAKKTGPLRTSAPPP